jgi:CelD/BcsL family acetyltransferase involved in cellulose biosynthesis
MIVESSDFPSLKPEWDKILLNSNHSIFSTWEWLSTWWRHFGKNKELLLLTVKENEKIMGIAPLMYSKYRTLGLNIGKIEFIGSPHSDYNNFITTQKHQECVESFVDYLNKHRLKWSSIDLTEIPQNAECLLLFEKTAETVKPMSKCSYFDLPETFDLFMKTLKCEWRRYMKRGLERLEKDFEVDFVDLSDPSSIKKGMNILFDLHQKRWQDKGQSGEFAQQAVREFHLDIAKTFSSKKWLGLYVLKLSGKPVAGAYGFEYDSTHWGYLTGLDPEYLEYGVGNLLVIYLVKQLIERNFKKLDMMRGGEDYKNHWRATYTSNQQAILIRKGRFSALKYNLYNEYCHQGNRALFALRNLAKSN